MRLYIAVLLPSPADAVMKDSSMKTIEIADDRQHLSIISWFSIACDLILFNVWLGGCELAPIT